VLVLSPGEGWRYVPGLVRGRSSCSMKEVTQRERERERERERGGEELGRSAEEDCFVVSFVSSLWLVREEGERRLGLLIGKFGYLPFQNF
jgi:hypothetical protein